MHSFPPYILDAFAHAGVAARNGQCYAWDAFLHVWRLERRRFHQEPPTSGRTVGISRIASVRMPDADKDAPQGDHHDVTKAVAG